jgi:hypothetical protein
MRIKEMALIAALVASVVPAVAQEATTTSATPAKKQVKTKLTQKQLDEAKAKLSLWLGESKTLKEDATNITKKIGELASSGKLPQDAAGVQTLQDLVNQLKGINDRLSIIERAIEDIMGYIEGQKEKLPFLANDVSNLKRTTFSSSMQTQYRDSDLPGQNDGFAMRETRLGVTHKINDRAKFKLQIELAGSDFGSVVNEPTQSTAQMRDAFLTYDIQPGPYGTSAIMGRQSLPIGYDIERSSTEREFPERAIYNTTFFPGERSTGIQLRHGLGPNGTVYVGAMNALTYNDPQQRTVQGPPGNRLAVLGGARYLNKKFNGGISGFFGKRASQSGPNVGEINPTNDRRFIYIDGAYTGLGDPRIVARAEMMFGHDRLPTAGFTGGNDARDVTGSQFQLGYRFNPQNELHARYETFDPDTDAGADRYTGTGLALLHYINPNARITLASERIRDLARTTKKRYGITTLRVQFKF